MKNLYKNNDDSNLSQKKNKDNKINKYNFDTPDGESKINNYKYYADFDEGECFCYICNKKHYFIDRKAKDGGCLTSGCNIN